MSTLIISDEDLNELDLLTKIKECNTVQEYITLGVGEDDLTTLGNLLSTLQNEGVAIQQLFSNLAQLPPEKVDGDYI